MGLIYGLGAALLYKLFNVLPDVMGDSRIVDQFSSLPNDIVYGLLSVVTFGVSGALMFGLLGGVVGDEIETKVKPNQGIRRSAHNAILWGTIIGLVSGLITAITGIEGLDISGGLANGLAFGVIGAMVYGGYACISHLALRLVLCQKGFLPLRLIPFLDNCVERIFLRKVGGGYIFVHRLLMEHFASLHDQPPTEHTG